MSGKHDWGHRRTRQPDALPEEERCVYPGCPWPREADLDLCKRYHLARWAPNSNQANDSLVPNDGLVDWRAIEIAANGERRTKLTWIERDIAIAMILGAGLDVDEVLERIGYVLSKDHDKYRRLLKLGRRCYGPDSPPREGAA